MKFLKKAFSRVRAWPWYWQAGAAVAIVAVVVVSVHALTRSAAQSATADNTTHVHIASVSSLASAATGPLPVVGVVTSVNHASILAQSSGEVVVLAKKLGDYVVAGSIIAQMENSSQRAAVQQAQGAYDAAEAALRNASGATAANSTITASQASQAAANATAAANTSLQSLYATLDDAVHTKADPLFTEPRTNPVLVLTTTDNQLNITLQNERKGLENTLADVHTIATNTDRADMDADIDRAVSESQAVVTFLNNVVDALNKAVPTGTVTASQISAYQTSLGTARASVTASISALATAKTSYDAAVASAASAQNSAGTGTSNNISAAEAAVEQALGSLNAAKAALEKTIIRSPISGTIVSLPLTQGGYVNAASQVADVSNPSALEIIANVTADDAKTLSAGSAASIEGGIQGVIVSIAPALDPTTGKVQVKIGIPGSAGSLTDGTALSVSLVRSTTAQKKVSNTPAQIQIPIVAAKITPDGAVAFSVTASSTLARIPVTLGTILGDKVTVLSGLTLDSVIVTDARGLYEGESVVVDSN